MGALVYLEFRIAWDGVRVSQLGSLDSMLASMPGSVTSFHFYLWSELVVVEPSFYLTLGHEAERIRGCPLRMNLP